MQSTYYLQKIYLKKKEILEKELYNIRVAQNSGLNVRKEGLDKLNELEALKAAREKAIADKKEADKKEKASIKRKEAVELKQEEKEEREREREREREIETTSRNCGINPSTD